MANRANARAARGPNTFHGRARSARNAFRHGLSLPIQSDQALCEAVQALARQIADSNPSTYINCSHVRSQKQNSLSDPCASRASNFYCRHLARPPVLTLGQTERRRRRPSLTPAKSGSLSARSSCSRRRKATTSLQKPWREAKDLEAIERYERRARDANLLFEHWVSRR